MLKEIVKTDTHITAYFEDLRVYRYHYDEKKWNYQYTLNKNHGTYKEIAERARNIRKGYAVVYIGK